MSTSPAHFYEELLNERNRIITQLRTRLFDLQQQSRMLGVIGGVIDSKVDFDKAKVAEEIKSLLESINRKVP
jgi:hypothetical protein